MMGPKTRIPLPAGRTVILMDSTGYADESDTGHVIVAGSHGGLAGKYGEIPIAALFINDAGLGKDNAGIASFATFDRLGVVAASYSHLSARIGDVQDAWDNGVVSHVNETARMRGVKVGEPVQANVRRVFGGLSP